VKKGAVIGLGAGCFVVVFAVAVLALSGSVDEISFEQGEELIMPSGDKICCEKYQMIHQVLAETVLMPDDMTDQYIIKNYRENPKFIEECSRLVTQMNKTPIKQKYEPLTDDEYRELQGVFKIVCRLAAFEETPPPYSPP